MGRSTAHYRKNSASRKKKAAYDTAFGKSSAQKKKRAELGRKRYADKKAGKNVAGKDYNHATKRYESPSKNRGYAEKSRLKGSKRKRK